MTGPLLTRAAVAGVSAAATAGSYRVLVHRLDEDLARWRRTNYAGAPVTLLAGPAVVAGLVAGTTTSDGLPLGRRLGLSALVASVGAVGAYDDLHGHAETKGLRGHLRALSTARVTTGVVKIGAVAAAGVAAAALLRPRGDTGAAPLLLDGALIAGAANLVNLFDLRPGRALKLVLGCSVLAAAAAGGGLAAPLAGAAAAALPADLRGSAMLGDCGANALGAVLGFVTTSTVPPVARRAALVTVAGVTLASERVSFSDVIERHSLLRRIDDWGRPARTTCR